MQLGIFAKTFDVVGAHAALAAVAEAGFQTAQINLACLGLPSMPDAIDADAAAEVGAASRATGIGVAAVSGTYNMIHPDPQVRRQGMARLAVLCGACAAMGTSMVTLCTGTRDPDDQWRAHPDNGSAQAWRDLMAEMELALALAERFDLRLGVEPELANVVRDAAAARRLLDAFASPRLVIVLDPANLFEDADAAGRRRVVEQALDLLGDSVAMAHAKDRNAHGAVVAAGHGVIDFPHFVSRLRKVGFDGPLVAHGLAAAEAPGVASFLRHTLSPGSVV